MFELIDCRLVSKTDFKLKQGYQPENALFYIKKGKIEYTMNGITETVGENELVSFPVNVFFERKMIVPLTFYYIRFENPGGHALPSGKIHIANNSRLLSTIEYLQNVQSIDSKLKKYYLNDIFMQIEAEKLIGNIKKDEVVMLAEKYFTENMKGKITLKTAAKAIGVSSSGLSLHFRDSIGISPIKYLNEMRIKRAETLICNTTLNIGEIAKECGFENAYYFSNTFKKYKGKSPNKYRKIYEL